MLLWKKEHSSLARAEQDAEEGSRLAEDGVEPGT